ncbi:inositol hexakisphosphate kinase 3-like isoform X1 [Apostichopus japonicus]|uniref:inositol hexakisphosphate kinase 3-like isoform X1 n=1 Tax=Stichopus japonicus TaxID=307972 RepID=UPI003AB33735
MGWQGKPRAMSKDEDGDWICLHPYNHQVGGHSGVCLLDKTTVCKPLVQEEYGIYETMSPALKLFVPKLKGCIDVKICKDTDDNVFLFTLAKKNKNGTLNNDIICEDCRRPSRNPQKAIDGSSSEIQQKVTISNGNNNSTCAFHTTSSNLRKADENYEVADNICEALNNPWSLRCWKRQLWTFEQKGVTQNCRYILLENLASKFKRPSILDLKIGTRGYGDDVTEEKRLAHLAKAKLSTAGTLGVRIGGMQVYQVDKDSYRRLTKHYGKSISDYDTLLGTIEEFFHDGNSIRKSILSKFIKRLKTLINVITNEEGCRFFGCSLLILYEGDLSQRLRTSSQDGETSDVGDSCLPSVVPSSAQHFSTNVVSQREKEVSCGNVDTAEGSSEAVPQKKPRLSDSSIQFIEKDSAVSVNEKKGSTINAQSPSSVSDLVLKVIDFPHVVYQNELTSTIYEGPDQDFLFGLNNLRQILDKIHDKV